MAAKSSKTTSSGTKKTTAGAAAKSAAKGTATSAAKSTAKTPAKGSAAKAPAKAAATRKAPATAKAKAKPATKPSTKPKAPPPPKIPPQTYNIVIVGQQGRLMYEAALFAASLRARSPAFKGRLLIAEPQPGERWGNYDPRIRSDEVRALLDDLGAEIIPFESVHFGGYYPQGNKIECLSALPKGEPFVFFDTDTLILDDLSKVPFDFSRPTASMKREGTWPKLELYGPGYSQIWKSLYDRFGLDFDSSLDLGQPDEYWQRYLYFNAGFFFYECPHVFGAKFLEYALSIRNDPTPETLLQELNPWLDQVALPLVIHALGGGRGTLPEGLLDGDITCHWRVLPLLYARESDKAVQVLEEVASPNKIKKVLKNYEPFKRMIFQGRGQKVRDMFDRSNLPRREQAIRNQIKKEGFWMR